MGKMSPTDTKQIKEHVTECHDYEEKLFPSVIILAHLSVIALSVISLSVITSSVISWPNWKVNCPDL